LCNGITIGDDVIIGAGTLVATNLPSGVKVVGNPMRLAPNLVLR
jgi:acetyltransferase-like isoleucine patch superfamily enzyme